MGPIKILIHVQLVKAREYALGNNGKLVLKTDWDTVKIVYPYQTIVPNLSVYNDSFSQYKSVDEVYKRYTKVFLLSTKYYGCMGKVLDTSMLAETKRIQSKWFRYIKKTVTFQSNPHPQSPSTYTQSPTCRRLCGCTKIPSCRHATIT